MIGMTQDLDTSRSLDPSHPFDLGNLLGAAAMAVMDGVWAATRPDVGHAPEAAAIVAIGHAPGLSNDGLGQVLGLSHPGTVRLVDRLVAAGMVERRPAADRRAIALHLTAQGTTCRAALLTKRALVLQQMLAPLRDDERDMLAALLAKMLTAVPRDALQVLSVCRLCDEQQCRNCPVVAGASAA